MQLARRILIIWLIDSFALWALALVVPGIELRSWEWALWTVATIGLLNALVRPLFLLVMMPFTILSVGLVSLFLNAGMVLAASWLLPGFAAADLVAALWVVVGVTAINTVVTGLLSINDDESFYRNVILRLARRKDPRSAANEPGLLILELDGLSAPALEQAIAAGYVPTIKRWLDEGTWSALEWDCGVPSQTSSSQAGILYGRNEGIPAFRWYEKDTQRLMVSNHPRTASEIHGRLSNGTGILAPNGASLSNILSGDAGRTVMTLSTIFEPGSHIRQRTGDIYRFFLNPYSFTRTLILMIWDVLRETGQRLRARFKEPRQPQTRGGSFLFLRAVANVFVRELNFYLVIENMLSGTPIIYSSVLGYDVVAHHAGPRTQDALLTLKAFDDGLQALVRAAARAPREYRFVVLSDHGQSPGASFRQRYGISLEQLVEEAVDGKDSVTASYTDDESWATVNALLSHAIQAENVSGRTARRILRSRTHDGYVEVRPGSEDLAQPDSNIVVCVSGNLAHVYFTDIPQKLTIEAISERFPNVLATLAAHPGIGFVQVTSATRGNMVVGGRGIHYLDVDDIAGVDPLETFGPRAADHLRRLATFEYSGDLIINSQFDPASGEVAAFEELVGSHGGLGGDQTRPFLLYPSEWHDPQLRISSPEDIYSVFRRWRAGSALAGAYDERGHPLLVSRYTDGQSG